jgi:hypothetical protein
MPPKDINYILQHKQFFLKESAELSPTKLRRGQVIHLTYEGKERWMLVLHPNWENKLHAIDLQHFPRRALLRILQNPMFYTIPPHQFYKVFLDQNWIKEYGAYRTYDLTKIGGIREVVYNFQTQPDERAEPSTEPTV